MSEEPHQLDYGTTRRGGLAKVALRVTAWALESIFGLLALLVFFLVVGVVYFVFEPSTPWIFALIVGASALAIVVNWLGRRVVAFLRRASDA